MVYTLQSMSICSTLVTWISEKELSYTYLVYDYSLMKEKLGYLQVIKMYIH